MCFSDFVPDAKVRYNLGYTYVFVAATNLVFYLGLMVKQNIKSLKRKMRKRATKHKNKQTEYEETMIAVKMKELSNRNEE